MISIILIHSIYAAPSDHALLNTKKGGEKITNQYIVVLKDNATVKPEEVARNTGGNILHIYNNAIKGFVIKVTNPAAIQALSHNPHVESIEQDQTVEANAQTLPTGIDRVDADQSSTKAGDGIGTVNNADVAILDTGIDLSHPDLNVVNQINFVSGTITANDDNGHGTHVAGIVGAKDNGDNVVGIAPGVRLWAIKVLDSNASGSVSNIIKGIDYVTQNSGQIDIVNLSLGFEGTSRALDKAINKSIASGITYIVAAGNDKQDASGFTPANNPNVITVTAIADNDGKCGSQGGSMTIDGSSITAKDDSFAFFSNFGNVVDMAAPGVNILSTYKGGTTAIESGTSMAAPHVTGAAALYKSTHVVASPKDIRNALLNSGSIISTPCDGNGHGYFSGDQDNFHEPLLYSRGY